MSTSIWFPKHHTQHVRVQLPECLGTDSQEGLLVGAWLDEEADDLRFHVRFYNGGLFCDIPSSRVFDGWLEGFELQQGLGPAALHFIPEPYDNAVAFRESRNARTRYGNYLLSIEHKEFLFHIVTYGTGLLCAVPNPHMVWFAKGSPGQFPDWKKLRF